MKKTKVITLALITSALASCHKEQPKEQNVFMRSDTTAQYQQVHPHNHSTFFWYYAFRPYGYYNVYGGSYVHSGYYSSSIRQSANLGSNAIKSSVVRGGFGHGSFSVSS